MGKNKGWAGGERFRIWNFVFFPRKISLLKLMWSDDDDDDDGSLKKRERGGRG